MLRSAKTTEMSHLTSNYLFKLNRKEHNIIVFLLNYLINTNNMSQIDYENIISVSLLRK